MTGHSQRCPSRLCRGEVAAQAGLLLLPAAGRRFGQALFARDGDSNSGLAERGLAVDCFAMLS